MLATCIRISRALAERLSAKSILPERLLGTLVTQTRP